MIYHNEILQHLETVIKSRIPGIQSLINKSIAEIEAELTRLGKPVAADAGVSVLVLLYEAVIFSNACFYYLDDLFFMFYKR